MGDAIALIVVVFFYLTPVWILIAASVADHLLTQAHIRSIEAREADLLNRVTVTNLCKLPAGLRASGASLCTGEVVMGCSHWRKFLAGFRNLVGGRMGSVEGILTRGRREALLRALQEATEYGANYALNVRFETANLSSKATAGKKGQFMVEIVAYLTAVRVENAPV